MGFLDKLSKGISDAATGISNAVSNAGAGTPPPPGPGAMAAPPPPGSAATGGFDDDFIDGTEPASWLREPSRPGGRHLADLLNAEGSLAGIPETFPEPDEFERDDAYVARYVSPDGTWTIDVASVTEDYLVRFGSMRAVFDSFRSQLQTSSEGSLGDGSLTGSSGAGHATCVTGLADMMSKVDVYGPAGTDTASLEAAACIVTREALRLG